MIWLLALHLHAQSWLKRPATVERLENGDIVVNVKEGDTKPPFKKRLQIEGGGRVRASAQSTFAYASDFERAARLSGYISESKYDPKTGLIDAKIEALGYKSDIQIKARATGDAGKRIEFELTKGPLKGLTARLDFRDVSPKKSEVVMNGEYGYDTFPIPKIFLEFGLEVVFQKMAFRLRQGAESEKK